MTTPNQEEKGRLWTLTALVKSFKLEGICYEGRGSSLLADYFNENKLMYIVTYLQNMFTGNICKEKGLVPYS